MDELKGELSATQGLMGQQERMTASQKADLDSRIHELERELEESRQTLVRWQLCLIFLHHRGGIIRQNYFKGQEDVWNKYITYQITKVIYSYQVE